MEEADHQQTPFFEERQASEIPLQMRPSTWQFQRKQSQASFNQSVFGDIFDPDASEFEQNVLQYRKIIFRQNLQKYAYSRSYHYYFDLDTFSRDPKSVTYARNASNALKATFSQDEKVYGGTKLKDIINREYFTLPANSEHPGNGRPSKAKNPSHQELFITEDKKLGFDRTILTLRHILNNIEQLIHTDKIARYALIHRDSQLQKILTQTLSLSQKRHMLIERLQGMQQARRISEKEWFAQDNINFAATCNQQLYEAMRQRLNSLNQRIMLPFLYTKHYHIKQLVKQSNADPYSLLKSVFTFAREDCLAVKEQTLTMLSNQYRNKILQSFKGNSNVIFPTHIFSFGNKKVLTIANQILGKRLRIEGNTEYYTLGLLRNKFFNQTLTIPEDVEIEDRYIFKLQASDYLTKIRSFVLSKESSSKRDIQLVDDEINLEELGGTGKGIFVMKRQQYKEISATQYFILMLWHWLCLIVQEMLQFLEQNEGFVEVMSSPHYDLINQSVSEAFKSPLVGTFSYCIKEIRSYLRQGVDMNFDEFRLQFQYDSRKNVGYLWRIQQIYSEEEGTHKRSIERQSEEQDDYDLLYFGKRVKSLEGEWA